MSEQAKRTRAAGKVIEDVMAAHEKGELEDYMVVGFRLMTTALAMKSRYSEAAVKIARDYCDLVGIDSDFLVEQVVARLLEHEQLEDIEKGLEDD